MVAEHWFATALPSGSTDDLLWARFAGEYLATALQEMSGGPAQATPGIVHSEANHGASQGGLTATCYGKMAAVIRGVEEVVQHVKGDGLNIDKYVN